MTDKTSERFWARVDKSGDCWMWTGYVRGNGYGQFGITNMKTVYAHRFAYELAVETIPEGLVIDHKCHNRACVNPEHLRMVTQKQNLENHSGPNSNNRQGIRGVRFNPRTGRYRALVMHDGHQYRKGEFDTPEEAAEVAKQMRLSLHTHNDADRRVA